MLARCSAGGRWRSSSPRWSVARAVPRAPGWGGRGRSGAGSRSAGGGGLGGAGNCAVHWWRGLVDYGPCRSGWVVVLGPVVGCLRSSPRPWVGWAWSVRCGFTLGR
ncbi:hypothetical protein FH715_16225 [Streptomyces sedi]|uniref:Uncharacterized protein n=1 Tax=Streptomyces sedi TaxID=555059 RepID=A0A5C4V0V8_9ACTN|nr:hypothetical protein FH715_16225 [Streptomyces sedi]